MEGSTIDNLINKNQITIFSKTYCPFCTRIKNFFSSLNVSFTVYEIDNNDLTQSQVKDLHTRTGVKTYPNVFIGLTNTKGCDNTLNLHQNKKLLKWMDNCGVKYSN